MKRLLYIITQSRHVTLSEITEKVNEKVISKKHT